jgi:hypothetical protein
VLYLTAKEMHAKVVVGTSVIQDEEVIRLVEQSSGDCHCSFANEFVEGKVLQKGRNEFVRMILA